MSGHIQILAQSSAKEKVLLEPGQLVVIQKWIIWKLTLVQVLVDTHTFLENGSARCSPHCGKVTTLWLRRLLLGIYSDTRLLRLLVR